MPDLNRTDYAMRGPGISQHITCAPQAKGFALYDFSICGAEGAAGEKIWGLPLGNPAPQGKFGALPFQNAAPQMKSWGFTPSKQKGKGVLLVLIYFLLKWQKGQLT